MPQLDGKIAVVTGGGSGVGYAIAERFAKEGAKVILVGRDAQKLKRAVEKIGEAATAIATDVSVDSEVKSLFDELERVDLLVTCAGGALFGAVEELPLPQIRELFATRFFGQLAACHYAVPKMPAGSVIIFCSGVADVVGMPYFSAGTAIDGAISSMTRSLALELAPRGIRVNAVSPGLISGTEIKSNMVGGQIQSFVETTLAQVPLKRPGQPFEVAQAAHFLATCAYATGQIIAVDGGWSAT